MVKLDRTLPKFRVIIGEALIFSRWFLWQRGQSKWGALNLVHCCTNFVCVYLYCYCIYPYSLQALARCRFGQFNNVRVRICALIPSILYECWSGYSLIKMWSFPWICIDLEYLWFIDTKAFSLSFGEFFQNCSTECENKNAMFLFYQATFCASTNNTSFTYMWALYTKVLLE